MVIMMLKGTTIILVILFSLFYNGVCRVPNVDPIPVKSIKKKNGQVYNCIPFHKQLAFSHPSIKFEAPKNIGEIQGRSQSKFGFEESCPLGTIPILNGIHTSTQPQWWRPFAKPHHHCKAIIRTRENNAKKFYGTRASISLHKAYAEPGQWSTGRMKLSNGAESIEAGWMVNVNFFKDVQAHLYVKFSVGGKECINTQCPGFVEVTKDVLGIIPDKYFEHGNTMSEDIVWDISIDKHQDDGNWWITKYSKGNEVKIGYYPKNLLTSLGEVAWQVEWGGEIDNPHLTDPQPDMGSGRVAEYNTGVSAFLMRVTVVDENFKSVEPSDTEKERDCLPFYNSLDQGSTQGFYFGRLMFFGGPDTRN